MDLMTTWGKNLDKEHVLPEYPRPGLCRDSYLNLNGYWDYEITEADKRPGHYSGRILVPFSPEASLSEAKRAPKAGQFLWYRRFLKLDVEEENKRYLLHFGAVDQLAKVYLNNQLVGSHLGGYGSFTCEITDQLKSGADNELIVKTLDLGEDSFFASGKQSVKRKGMFYTAQSGIWQSVWLEAVPKNYVKKLKITPLYDEGAVSLEVVSDVRERLKVSFANEEALAVPFILGESNERLVIKLKEKRSWSPEDPYLYEFKVEMGEDVITSYFGLRKISVAKDERGIPRLFLNNEPYFQKGVIDQGYWPESLMTPMADAALIYDIQQMKDLGFNMIRKHAKVESARFYYHCDRLGMLVWQDMVSGGDHFKPWFVTYAATLMEWFKIKKKDNFRWLTGRRKPLSKLWFLKEAKETINQLYNYPSIVVWSIFNEGWGQFDGVKVTRKVVSLDGSRLYDTASGWFDQGCGDIRSHHNYFLPLKIKAEPERVSVLSEYGGFSLSIPGHRYCEKVYGYRIFNDEQKLSAGYEKLHRTQIFPNIEQGLSATIYTQLSDIEEEVNGLLTYDRKLLKIDKETVRKMNQGLTLRN